ncbi:ELWxxDGT repeat protein [Archangium lipolyticum]|uniref:ELWxxDGT repeat protein n=1 Tax=Archangium lipolyticum TaxID=2970465 RepID=UPI002149D047|nr:ELWxxDGT repeat protein [Archangium lipolyticum]
MGSWRGVVLLCSLVVGCGGAETGTGGSGDSGQENELPPESAPSGGDGERTGAPPAPTPPPAPATPPGAPTLGTAHLVKDLFPPSSASPWTGFGPGLLVDFQGRLFFGAFFEDGRTGLWTSDGTAAGTVQVKDFPAFQDTGVKELTPLGQQLFFASGDTAHGQELWVSDGTPGGTRQVKDIAPGAASASPYALTPLNGSLLFFCFRADPATSSGRTELWKSDGTEAGTVLVRDMGNDSSLSFSRVRVGNTLFFSFTDPAHGTELWKTDGTGAGTVLVKDIQPGTAHSYPTQPQALGTSVFFLTSTPSQGRELWRTDGTEAGTTRVREIAADPQGPTATLLPGSTDNQLFLALADPSDQLMRLYSLELDGAGAVQERLVTTLPNTYAQQPDALPYITTATRAGGKLFFGQALSSPGPSPRDVQLWVTDGTAAGTRMLSRPLSRSDEFTTGLYALDDRILYSNTSDAEGLEPWVTDGTAAGTRLVQDIASSSSSYPHGFTRVGSSVFFVATDSLHGSELWRLPLED